MGSPCPAESRIAHAQGLLDKSCFTRRLDDQPKADVLGDQEVEVSHSSPSLLSLSPSQRMEGAGQYVGPGPRQGPSQVPAAADVGRCAQQGRLMGNAMKPASFCFPIWEAKISSLIPMVPTPSPEAWAPARETASVCPSAVGPGICCQSAPGDSDCSRAKKHSHDP